MLGTKTQLMCKHNFVSAEDWNFGIITLNWTEINRTTLCTDLHNEAEVIILVTLGYNSHTHS